LDGALLPRMIPRPLRGRFWRWARFWWLLGAARLFCGSVGGLSGGVLVGAILSANELRIADPVFCTWPWPSRRRGGRFWWRQWFRRLLAVQIRLCEVEFCGAGTVTDEALAIVIGVESDGPRLFVVVDRFRPVRRHR